jgi:hypothetical protein
VHYTIQPIFGLQRLREERRWCAISGSQGGKYDGGRQQVPLKRRQTSSKLHGATTKKTDIFTDEDTQKNVKHK